MTHIALLLGLLGILSHSRVAIAEPVKVPVKTWPEGVVFDKIEGDTLHFKSQTGSPSGVPPIKSGLFEPKYLGFLTAPQGAPYFVLLAKPCKACVEEPSVYFIRPGQNYAPGEKHHSTVQPGAIYDNKTKAIVYEGRAFIGRCLDSNQDVYVAFQRERVDRKHGLVPSVFIARPGLYHLHEELRERRLPKLATTLKRLKSKTCLEIPGRSRNMLARPLDLKTRPDVNTEEDEEDENKTEKSDPAPESSPDPASSNTP
jgi:hypothetical protein